MKCHDFSWKKIEKIQIQTDFIGTHIETQNQITKHKL